MVVGVDQPGHDDDARPAENFRGRRLGAQGIERADGGNAAVGDQHPAVGMEDGRVVGLEALDDAGGADETDGMRPVCGIVAAGCKPERWFRDARNTMVEDRERIAPRS
jgi:hypothetical protein